MQRFVPKRNYIVKFIYLAENRSAHYQQHKQQFQNRREWNLENMLGKPRTEQKNGCHDADKHVFAKVPAEFLCEQNWYGCGQCNKNLRGAKTVIRTIFLGGRSLFKAVCRVENLFSVWEDLFIAVASFSWCYVNTSSQTFREPSVNSGWYSNCVEKENSRRLCRKTLFFQKSGDN